MPKSTDKKEKELGKFAIPESEYSLSFSRSGGKGGQNVNKVETKVTLRWNVWRSGVLSQEQKEMVTLYAPLANKMDKDGTIIIYEQSARTQEQNRNLLLEKFSRFVNEAITPPKERFETLPPPSAEKERLSDKKALSKKKSARVKIKDSDY